MGKHSKRGDLWRHVFAAAADRPDTWCESCGYYHIAHGIHRADCAVTKSLSRHPGDQEGTPP